MKYTCDCCKGEFELNGENNFLGVIGTDEGCEYATDLLALCDYCYPFYKDADGIQRAQSDNVVQFPRK